MGVPLYDYRRWPNFTKSELACKHTGLENPNEAEFIFLMDWVQFFRSELGVPFEVTSAYRHQSHPDERDKVLPGQHTLAAIDLKIPVQHCHRLSRLAFAAGCTGMGWKLHGDLRYRFIHLDFRKGPPRIWSYP